MMRLALMRAFFDTVDQDWQSPIADKIASRWPLAVATVKCVRASANLVCQVAARDKQYFLRFNHESERKVESIEAELGFLRHLALHGIRVARPVASSSGEFVESVATDLGQCHAVLFEALGGRHLPLEELDGLGFERWGAALGQLHIAGKGYECAKRPTWSAHVEQARRQIPASAQWAVEELGWIAERLAELAAAHPAPGLIHYDFELDNIMWQGTEPGIMDFDDCACYWYEADLAHALRDLFDDRAERVDLEDPRLCAFLRGYRSVRTLEDEAVRRIPLFLRLHNLVSCARLIRALGDAPEDDEPKWAAGLRSKLSGKVEAHRQSCLAHPLRGPGL